MRIVALFTFLATVASQDIFLAERRQNTTPAALAARYGGGALEGEWTVKEHTPHFDPSRGLMINTTRYTSPDINLITGGARFTLAGLTNVPFPKGDYTLVRADFRIIDSQGKDVPLNEVYNHHWLIPGLEYCEHNLYFGAGAEMRGTPTIVPKGYGVKRIGSRGYCGANIHLIRTEDLATHWTGLNDPKGDHGAAVKHCAECGYAPGRAHECSEPLDGNFACCFTGSRCPVNNPQDKSTKTYKLQYDVQWTRDLSSTKVVRIGVFDVSGGAVEWNVAPDLTMRLVHQVCTDTVCNITNSITVGYSHDFAFGICPGTMLWSYMHQHVGAISGTMFVNGDEICQSTPIYGTDPNNAPGNEKGYIVGFKRCIDSDVQGNSLRLNKGDVITVTALYDVNPSSTIALPFPGGKHGGIMALFFYYMDCDADTFAADYVCRDSACVPVGKGTGTYKTSVACEKAC